MTEIEMLKTLVEVQDIAELGKALSMSPQKIHNILSGVEEMKKHHAYEIRSHYKMKANVKAYSDRMKEFSL